MIVGVSSLLAIPYVWKSMECLCGLIRLHKGEMCAETGDLSPTIAVIVAVKNEERNVGSLLECLKNQVYAPSEIIVIDDNSTDGTLSLIRDYCGANDLDIKVVESDGCGKKHALYCGVKACCSDYCLFTDADCVVSHHWVEEYDKKLRGGDWDLIAGAVHETHNGGIVQQLQCVEFESLQAVTAASFALNSPIMCNGANLCVKRSVWLDVRESNGLRDMESGDDVFMLHEIKKRGGGVSYLLGGEASVFTATSASIGAFFNQRMRWGGKSVHYKDVNSVVYACVVFVFCVAMMGMLVMGMFDWWWLVGASVMGGVKVLCDSVVIGYQSKRNGLKFSLLFIMLFSLLHPFYIVCTALGGWMKVWRWK